MDCEPAYVESFRQALGIATRKRERRGGGSSGFKKLWAIYQEAAEQMAIRSCSSNASDVQMLIRASFRTMARSVRHRMIKDDVSCAALRMVVAARTRKEAARGGDVVKWVARRAAAYLLERAGDGWVQERWTMDSDACIGGQAMWDEISAKAQAGASKGIANRAKCHELPTLFKTFFKKFMAAARTAGLSSGGARAGLTRRLLQLRHIPHDPVTAAAHTAAALLLAAIAGGGASSSRDNTATMMVSSDSSAVVRLEKTRRALAASAVAAPAAATAAATAATAATAAMMAAAVSTNPPPPAGTSTTTTTMVMLPPTSARRTDSAWWRYGPSPSPPGPARNATSTTHDDTNSTTTTNSTMIGSAGGGGGGSSSRQQQQQQQPRTLFDASTEESSRPVLFPPVPVASLMAAAAAAAWGEGAAANGTAAGGGGGGGGGGHRLCSLLRVSDTLQPDNPEERHVPAIAAELAAFRGAAATASSPVSAGAGVMGAGATDAATRQSLSSLLRAVDARELAETGVREVGPYVPNAAAAMVTMAAVPSNPAVAGEGVRARATVAAPAPLAATLNNSEVLDGVVPLASAGREATGRISDPDVDMGDVNGPGLSDGGGGGDSSLGAKRKADSSGSSESDKENQPCDGGPRKKARSGL